LVLPLGSKFVECKTSTACGAALDPYRDAPGMSFVLYLFMLDEFGTSGVCGEERISLNKCSRTYRARTIRKKSARHLVRAHSRLDLDRTRARIDVRPPVRYRSLRMHNLFGTSSPGRSSCGTFKAAARGNRFLGRVCRHGQGNQVSSVMPRRRPTVAGGIARPPR
jgi:hypothetical protein